LKTAFFYATAFLFMLNLLLMGDVLSISSGAEARVALQALQGDTTMGVSPLVTFLYGLTGHLGEGEIYLRLGSTLAVLLAFATSFMLGRKLFGGPTMALALAIAASGLLVSGMGKFAFADNWLFLFQTVNFFAALLYVKQPVWKWKAAYLLSLLAALLTHFLFGLLFSLIVAAMLWRLHPMGKNALRLDFWAAWLVAGFVTNYWGISFWSPEGFWLAAYEGSPFGRFFVIQILGLLPWLALLPVAIKHNFLKVKNKEELAIILVTGFWAALLGHSLVLQLVLAIAFAKQVQACTMPYFPYGKLLKTASVFQMLLLFGLMFAFMFQSYSAFGMDGFRAATPPALLFWGLGFLGVLGVFSQNRRLMLGGMALSGLLGALAFWLYWVPLPEAQFNYQKRLALAVAEKGKIANHVDMAELLPFRFYLGENNAPQRDSLMLEAVKTPVADTTNAIIGWHAWRDTVAYRVVSKE
jgi:hypothetical protein